MTAGAIESLRADREALLGIAAGLTEADWKAPSGCPGWSVQDVVAHMGVLFWMVVDRSVLPDVTELATEEAQDRCVAARRSWSAAQVREDYETISATAIDALVGFETLDMVLPLGDLGTYPASVLPNAYAFDHYTHIRADLFSPRGPLTSRPPASDAVRLEPTVEWIAVAAAQQNDAVISSLDGAVAVDVSGPAARRITIGEGDVVATVACSAHELVLWATQRATWDELGVTATGRPDAIAAAQKLHVF
jgi:uncharacterized protein (TIGR03083 family)